MSSLSSKILAKAYKILRENQYIFNNSSNSGKEHHRICKFTKYTVHWRYYMPIMPYNNRHSRGTYIFSIISWGMLGCLTIILYNYLTGISTWTPATLRLIDEIYIIARIFFFTATFTSIISLIFREIRHSWAIENIFIRRFLPIIRFFILAIIWIIAGFYGLDSLNINTNNLLAWAGIGWAILALASRDIMSNLFWSLSILLSRTFDIGERIRVKWSKWHYEWIVEEITLNYTKLTNYDTGEVVFIPNKIIYAEIIENVSRSRFYVYTYLIPLKKNGYSGHDIQKQLHIIEGKIEEFNPISIDWEMENPNAMDYMYKVIVKMPTENDDFDREIREFIMPYIFTSPKE
jgi:small-conductance mechanosensitive channel